jgi:hypothetical protein
MKTKYVFIKYGIVAIFLGIFLVILARLLLGHASWGVRWILNAIGFILIGSVIIPLCEAIKDRSN